MKLNFKRAGEDDIKRIYKLARNFNYQRIFGLQKSIDDGDVWILEYDGNVIGMCRISDGKTLDYLKFNELLVKNINKTVVKYFMKKVKVLAVKYGYIKMKVTSNKVMTKIFEDNGWELDGKRFKFSNDGKKSYYDNIYTAKVNKFNYKLFGVFIV